MYHKKVIIIEISNWDNQLDNGPISFVVYIIKHICYYNIGRIIIKHSNLKSFVFNTVITNNLKYLLFIKSLFHLTNLIKYRSNF